MGFGDVASNLRASAPGGTFVDVGAHMGHCSLMAATLVGAAGLVVAFEANPETFQRLSQNVRASRATVSLQPVACSDSETLLDLFVPSDSNTGSASISRHNASLAGARKKATVSRRGRSMRFSKR